MRVCGGFGFIFATCILAMPTGFAAAGNPQTTQRAPDAVASASQASTQHSEFPPLQNADPEVNAGYRIAQDVCETCHVVHPGQKGRPILRQPGPDFADIANRPALTRESLTRLIASQTWDMRTLPVRMPKQPLSERSTARVAAYILSLRTRP